MSTKHHTAIEIADARIALLHTIGHLQALGAMAQTATQRDTALQLAARLTSVLPLIDDHTPSNCPSVDSQGKKGEPAVPGTGGSGLPHMLMEPARKDLQHPDAGPRGNRYPFGDPQ